MSYQRVIDSISDKAQNLVQASSDPQLARFVSQTSVRYQKLSDAAKVGPADFHIRIVNVCCCFFKWRSVGDGVGCGYREFIAVLLCTKNKGLE